MMSGAISAWCAVLAAASLVACSAAPPAPATPAQAPSYRPVDDSYTVSQRFESYKDRYAGIARPVVQFQPGQQVLFDRQYKQVGKRALQADVFLPVPGKSRQQGILLVHGGGWRSGGKSHFYPLANALAQRGYTVILPEFRLSPEAKYPAGLVDVNDALAWAKQHAAEFGFRPERLALGGASSGGQMAALLAYAQDEALFKSADVTDSTVHALVDLDGVLDFTTPLALQFENAAGARSAAATWLGGTWEQVPGLWREASAVTHLTPKAPPTLVISSGLPRFTAGHEAVQAALARFGVRYQFYAFTQAPHDIWLFEPYLGRIVDTVDGFLQTVTATP